VNNWDISDITDMSQIFECVEDFNEDISGWDVSSIKLLPDAEKHLNMKIFRECLTVEFIK
jgi:hypothetical protein